MSADQKDGKFDAWGFVEIFGHQRLAGRISEQAIGGCGFVRIDVPAVGDAQAYTKLYGQAAIFSMTITTEEVARALASGINSKPISTYDIPELREKQLPVFNEDEDDDFR